MDRLSLLVRAISTHTSRVGCDDGRDPFPPIPNDFYSHIPCGMWRLIGLNELDHRDFYSHIPCGMWRTGSHEDRPWMWFLLTHPVWDVTSIPPLYNLTWWISTHTSRVGCDDDGHHKCQHSDDFYSHIPCGMWQEPSVIPSELPDFYSHIPCGMWLYLIPHLVYTD